MPKPRPPKQKRDGKAGRNTIRRTYNDAVKLEAAAFEGAVFRIRASGHDPCRESLLERYGCINPLTPASGIRRTAHSLTTSDNHCLTLSAQPGFTLARAGTTLTKTRSGTKVATAPTHYSNKGYRLDLPLHRSEKLIGFGDHQRKQLPLNGLSGSLWITYKLNHVPVPFFMSSRGYGIFFNTTRKVQFDFGRRQTTQSTVAVAGDMLDIYVITGESYDDMIRKYTSLTGRPSLPPRSAFGLWMLLNEHANAHEAVEIARLMRRERIPCDNIGLEPGWMDTYYDYTVNKDWSTQRFKYMGEAQHYRGGPSAMIRTLRRLGFNTGLWLNSRYDFTWEEERRVGERGETIEVRREEESLEGIEISHEDEQVGHDPVRMDTHTIPEQPWFAHLEKFVDDGVRFFKIDPALLINEFPDRLYGNGRRDDEMHNLAYMLCSRQTCGGYETMTGRRPYLISCGGWAGVQRFSGTWTGDTGGGEQPMCGILQDAVVGHAFATCDMNTTSLEGIHMGFLLPWALINSWQSFEYPPYQDDFLMGVFRDYATLRMRLVPYLYSLAHQAARSGRALARPMMLAYPDAAQAYDLRRQFLLGDSLLVNVYGRNVTLPAGEWFDYWNNTVVRGKWKSVRHDFPRNRGGHLFVREGGIVPLGPVRQYTSEGAPETITWQIFPGAEPSEFTLYTDDGDSLEYRNGAYAAVTLFCKPSMNGLRIEWGKIEGREPKRIERMTHAFEILGHRSVTKVGVGGRKVEHEFDSGANRIRFGPVKTGERVEVEWGE